MSRRFLGLDLAWSARNPSGTAALDAAGRVVDVRADLRSDDDLLAWVRSHLGAAAARGDAVAIGIDMPTIVRNAAGARPCETALRRAFGRFHAGPHPANLGRFPDGGRARRMIDALAADGIVERIDVGAGEPGRFAFEVFPHPALVRLFTLPRIFRYKKKSRPWAEVLSEWSRYRAALATLGAADPPLVLPDDFPASVTASRYKRSDDAIDAIACAYVASFVWRWGMAAPHVEVFGDLTDGYVLVPARGAWHEGSKGTVTGTALDREDCMPKTAPAAPEPKDAANQTFLTDVKALRARAREHVEQGAVTPDYQGDVKQTIDILQSVLATEIVCVLRYTMHAVAAEGIASDSVKEEFMEHADEEREHMMAVAERINQLGGKPNFNPEGLASRSVSQYAEGDDLVDMIKENLIAERIAVEHYRELVRFFADHDITTRVMLEGILVVEEEHASDMHDLLVAHEGRPFIKS